MLKVNAARLLQDLNQLAQIGAVADSGVSRPALSAADAEAREWFRTRVESDGFEYRMDGAGNQSAVLPAPDVAARTLLLGSHLDTVPNGGKFDGTLGTLAALEVLRTVRDAALRLPVHLEAISFTDEEGHILGLLGSQAAAGKLTPDDLQHMRGDPDYIIQGLARVGITHESILAAQRNPTELLAYLELHIEQGSRLEESGIDIGIVTAIVGIRSYWLTFIGDAAHAGTMPMNKRADALWGAVDFIQRAREVVVSQYSPGVMNCGLLHTKPGAFNIVPGQVELALEFRHGTEEQLDDMQNTLLNLAQDTTSTNDLQLHIKPAGHHMAAQMDSGVIHAFEEAAAELGLKSTHLFSFAGHDAQSMSKIIPSGMIFVPSVGGVSHNPREMTLEEDILNGANALLHAALKIVS